MHSIRETGFTHGVPASGNAALEGPAGSRPLALVSLRIVPSAAELPADYVSDSHAQALYTYWAMDTTFEIDEGLVAMPIASSSVDSLRSTDESGNQRRDTVAIIGLHDPIARRITRVSGERVGLPPEFRKAEGSYKDRNGITHTLMRRIIKPAPATRTPDGQLFHRFDAEYHYTLSRPPAEGDQMDVGENPWDRLGVQTIDLTGTAAPSKTTRLAGNSASSEKVPNDQL